MRGFTVKFGVVMALALAGCGGTTTKTVTTPAPPAPTTVGGHQCGLGGDTAMQCELPPAPRHLSQAGGPFYAHGVDFAWGGPRSCAAMRSIGATFAIGYLSYDPSKNLDRPLVDAFHACGIKTVVGWETTAARATQGFAAGVSDANEARRQAAVLGNTDRPLWFAIDFDANGPEVLSYFQGVHAVLGARTQDYGSYRVTLYLYNHGVVGHQNFQTYAWSGGYWLPASIAPLEQYLNGNTYDNDRAIAADYGQFPYAAAPIGPSPQQIQSWRNLRDEAFRIYKVNHCKAPVGRAATNGCHKQAAKVFAYQVKLNPTQHRPVCWGPKAQLWTAICRVARPAVDVWYADRYAARKQLQKLTCFQAAGQGERRRVCFALASRVDYLSKRIHSMYALY